MATMGAPTQVVAAAAGGVVQSRQGSSALASRPCCASQQQPQVNQQQFWGSTAVPSCGPWARGYGKRVKGDNKASSTAVAVLADRDISWLSADGNGGAINGDLGKGAGMVGGFGELGTSKRRYRNSGEGSGSGVGGGGPSAWESLLLSTAVESLVGVEGRMAVSSVRAEATQPRAHWAPQAASLVLSSDNGTSTSNSGESAAPSSRAAQAAADATTKAVAAVAAANEAVAKAAAAVAEEAGVLTAPEKDAERRAEIERVIVNGEPVGDGEPDWIWRTMRVEARIDSENEPALASFIYSTILAHQSLERALSFHLANKLSSATLLSTQLFSLFSEAILSDPYIRECIRADLQAVRERDPACLSYSHSMLFFKGFNGLQAYRIAHHLWNKGRKSLALCLQARIAEVFHMDIHPAARVGKAVLIDHATGLVIGETAVVGDDVSILHNVTLGGTGVAGGDRHPKVGNGVLIGAGVVLLGNISVGDGVKVGAGSVVISDIPPNSTAVGVPARVLETSRKAPRPEERPGLLMDQISNLWSDFII